MKLPKREQPSRGNAISGPLAFLTCLDSWPLCHHTMTGKEKKEKNSKKEKSSKKEKKEKNPKKRSFGLGRFLKRTDASPSPTPTSPRSILDEGEAPARPTITMDLSHVTAGPPPSELPP